MFASSTARVLYLRVGVRVGKREWKRGRFCGGRFSVSLAAAAAQPLFLQKPGVVEAAKPEGGSWSRGASVWARVSAFRLKSALISVRLFWSSRRIWS